MITSSNQGTKFLDLEMLKLFSIFACEAAESAEDKAIQITEYM